MAALIIPQNSKAIKGRIKRPLPGVDLTAMVDLAFLLITFFMLTTSLAKMAEMDIVKPVDPVDVTDYHDYPASRTMTIVLGKHNQAVYYFGEAFGANMHTVHMSDLKSSILAGKARVAETHQTVREKVMLVIIKPTNGANYKNFVDVIDEMKINAIATYAIDDDHLLDEERKFMGAKGI